LLINCNIATFLTGSALIPLGLNWWQAIIGMDAHYPYLIEALESIG
jgi:cytosine/uracil/thiamine/allantoin permease